MFTRIKSKFARKPSHDDVWNALRDAGYRDVPRHYHSRHAREAADRERLGVQPMGHLF